MKKIKIEIGDYSGDGHNISEVVELLCNRTIQELEVLYKKSCELTGLQFTSNGDESGRNRDWQEMGKWKVLQEYQEHELTNFQIEEFEKHGIVVDDSNFKWQTNRFANLFLRFLRLSDKELEWKFLEEKEEKEEILQLFIGYGIYDDF